MKVTARKLIGDDIMRRACEMTLRPGMTSNARLFKLYRCEHSPIRTQTFWIEAEQIPTFVSVHLVRHKIGFEPFVQSNRDDRGGDAVVTRDTPVNMGMLTNAAALIAVSRKRLCLCSHKRTVAVWLRVRRAIREADPVLADFMVPECVYRGFCPEMRECKPGASAIIEAYSKDNPAYSFRLNK